MIILLYIFPLKHFTMKWHSKFGWKWPLGTKVTYAIILQSNLPQCQEKNLVSIHFKAKCDWPTKQFF